MTFNTRLLTSGFAVLLIAQGVVAAEVEENEVGIPYAEVLPDQIIIDALPDMTFSDQGYDVVRPDRVEGAIGDESTYPVTKPDFYSDGKTDPETVYLEMGDKMDDEAMVYVEPGKDPDNILPPPTVIAFDQYSTMDVSLTYPSEMIPPNIGVEDRIFLLINQPPEIQRVKAKIEERALREEFRRKRSLIQPPSVQNSSPVEILETN